MQSKPGSEQSPGEKYFLAHYEEIMGILSSNLEVFNRNYTPELEAQFKDSRIPGRADTGHNHNDLHPGNILFDETGTVVGVSTLYDFGVSAINHRVGEFNNILLGEATPEDLVTLKKSFVDAAIQGYQDRMREVLPGAELNQAEIRGVKETLRLRLLWNVYRSILAHEWYSGLKNALQHENRIPYLEKYLELLKTFDTQVTAASLGAAVPLSGLSRENPEHSLMGEKANR